MAMAYEFRVVGVEYEWTPDYVPDPAASGADLHELASDPFEGAVSAMNAASADGWEMISHTLGHEIGEDDRGAELWHVRLSSVWRRPIGS